ncbi:SDR family NAD(P)-dependent oxidoreductase [Frankia sp. R82]|uniref:SDR family NAD(P)-dependent oxidoreductase n=1 Tax=Frankia sp. R82 TaxID=2950553 RepID=UPI0035ABDEAB
MTGRFAGRRAVVTGGGSGIGRAIAMGLAAEGAAVAVAGRRADALAETIDLIEAAGGQGIAVPTDVTRERDVEQLVATTVDALGGLDIAVNDAGVHRPGLLADLDEATWQSVISVNLTGTWLSMKHEIGQMRRSGGGAIVNIASNLGAHARLPGMGAYVASKAGVSALTRNAALEYIDAGIRINAVSPGPVDTPMSYRPGESRADWKNRLKSTNPAGRGATVQEIADAALWLVSPAAGFTVGHDLVIDGGASS